MMSWQRKHYNDVHRVHVRDPLLNTTATVITGEGGDRDRDQDQGVMIVRAVKNVYIWYKFG